MTLWTKNKTKQEDYHTKPTWNFLPNYMQLNSFNLKTKKYFSIVLHGVIDTGKGTYN